MKKISVVIEWENVQLSEMDRCRRMLRELHRQILELNARTNPALDFEILVAVNEHIPPALVRAELAQAFQPADPHIEWRLTLATGLNYYALKNIGAQQSVGDIIFFLDSDVIPEPGWLATLLNSFGNPDVNVVAGHTYLDQSDFLGRAMALSWLFSLRATEAVLKESPVFHANNFAIRRGLVGKFEFPKMMPGATRGACVQLAVAWRNSGMKIHQHTGAQVSHPPPNGGRHFFIRGLAQGRDDLLLRRTFRGQSWFGRESYRELRRSYAAMFAGGKAICRQRENAGLSRREVPLALGVVVMYWHCRLMGAWAMQFFPKFTGNHFRI